MKKIIAIIAVALVAAQCDYGVYKTDDIDRSALQFVKTFADFGYNCGIAGMDRNKMLEMADSIYSEIYAINKLEK